MMKTLDIRCPICHRLIKCYTKIVFLEGFRVMVSGTCCGAVLSSDPLNILELLPDEKKRTH